MGQREFSRHKRVNEEIRRILGPLIQQLNDPRIGLATIMSVEVNRDYSLARVFVSVLGSQDAADSIRALNHAGGLLRRELAHRAAMRTTPRLRFILDDTAERAERLNYLINDGLPDDG